MVRAAVIGGLVIILIAAGALGVRLYQTRAEALGLIRLGDEQFREGHYLKALETYQRSNAVKASPHARERIRLAQDTLRTQRAPLPSAGPTAGARGAPSAPASAPAPGFQATNPPVTAPTVPPAQHASGQAVRSRLAAGQVRALLRQARFGEVQELVS